MGTPGSLREPFSVLKPTRVRNLAGQPVISDYEPVADLRGRFVVRGGGELITAGKYEGRTNVQIETRYIDGITTDMVVVHTPTDRRFEIRGFASYDYHRAYMTLDVVEVNQTAE